MSTKKTTNNWLIRLAIGLLLLAVLVLEFDINISLANNAYLTSKSYSEVRVLTGDSVWSIASKMVSEREDIREFIYAIRQVNNLSPNAEIHPGQILKIPIKSKNPFPSESSVAKSR